MTHAERMREIKQRDKYDNPRGSDFVQAAEDRRYLLARVEDLEAVTQQVASCGIQYRAPMNPSDAVLIPSNVYDLCRAVLSQPPEGDK